MNNEVCAWEDGSARVSGANSCGAIHLQLITCEVIAAFRDPFDDEAVDFQDGGCAVQRRAICIHRKV